MADASSNAPSTSVTTDRSPLCTRAPGIPFPPGSVTRPWMMIGLRATRVDSPAAGSIVVMARWNPSAVASISAGSRMESSTVPSGPVMCSLPPASTTAPSSGMLLPTTETTTVSVPLRNWYPNNAAAANSAMMARLLARRNTRDVSPGGFWDLRNERRRLVRRIDGILRATLPSRHPTPSGTLAIWRGAR